MFQLALGHSMSFWIWIRAWPSYSRLQNGHPFLIVATIIHFKTNRYIENIFILIKVQFRQNWQYTWNGSKSYTSTILLFNSSIGYIRILYIIYERKKESDKKIIYFRFDIFPVYLKCYTHKCFGLYSIHKWWFRYAIHTHYSSHTIAHICVPQVDVILRIESCFHT